MKSNREIQRQARQLFRACLVDGRLDDDRLRQEVAKLKAAKPRGVVAVLTTLHRLARLEKQRHHAVVESATPADAALQGRIIAGLRSRFGPDVTAEFRTSPGLIGGLRIRLGSDVLDGSVKARLDKLADTIGR